MLAGTDKDDPCDPDMECVACLALKPAATPTPTAAPTAKPTAEPTPTEEPGFEAIFAHFSFCKKEKLVSLVKLSFLKKGLC